MFTLHDGFTCVWNCDGFQTVALRNGKQTGNPNRLGDVFIAVNAMKKLASYLPIWGACVLPLLATPALLAAQPQTNVARRAVEHRFAHRSFMLPTPGTETRSVSVAGTFNGWNKDALPMAKDADGKTWRVTAALPYGKQTYKFVVNGEKVDHRPEGREERGRWRRERQLGPCS
jgi:hypothetical protein